MIYAQLCPAILSSLPSDTWRGSANSTRANWLTCSRRCADVASVGHFGDWLAFAYRIYVQVREAQRLLCSTVSATAFNISIKDGSAAGSPFEHFHVHIVPRASGDFEVSDHVFEVRERSPSFFFTADLKGISRRSLL
jgi:hypothetical protein